MGIRLDGGTAYSGAVITRYYDSLLEKVTAWARTESGAIARMDRALREFRIRGVSTNIAFVQNLLKHPTFLQGEYTTKFIDTTPDLFHFKQQADRGSKILRYIADINVAINSQMLRSFVDGPLLILILMFFHIIEIEYIDRRKEREQNRIV